MKRAVLAFTLSILHLHNQVAGQARLVDKVIRKGTELVIAYEKYALPNGLTLIIHEDHSDPIVQVDVTYHVGSAREENGKTGYANLLHKIMLQGSDHVKDKELFKMVNAVGGTANSSVNRDCTNFYETVPANQLEKMLWLEADRMGFLLDAVTQGKFEIQRTTVKAERNSTYDDRCYGTIDEVTNKNLYPYGHPYSWLTIGYTEDLKKANLSDLKNFFLRWYGPNNATVSVGGDVNSAEVVKLVEKYFGPIPPGPEVQKIVVPAVSLEKDRYISYIDTHAWLPLLNIVFPTVPYFHKDIAALACLAQILGQGNNSILYKQLVKPSLALQVNVNSQLGELAGEFVIRISPSPGKSLSEVEKRVRASLDSFEKYGATDDDINKFTVNAESQYLNGLQRVWIKTSQLAFFQTVTGNPNMIGELMRMYSSVTKDDVKRVYDTYIKGQHAVVTSVLPKDKPYVAAAPAPDNYTIDTTQYTAPGHGYTGLKYIKAPDHFDRSKVPGNGPNSVMKLPSIWRKELPNGIRFIGAENTEMPLVTIILTIPGGHLSKAGDTAKVGLANLFACMMNEDTEKYTSEAMTIALKQLGADIDVSSSRDKITFTVKALTKYIDKTLELLQERLFNATFYETTFKRVKHNILENLKQNKTHASDVASDVLAKINYGADHILAKNELGTENSIKNITLKDIQNYYNNYLTSRNTRVAIVGNIKRNEILSKLSFLNRLPDKHIALTNISAKPKEVAKPGIYLIDLPNSDHTEFLMGYVTGLKYDAIGDYYKAGLMNYVLGGGINCRLNTKLQEEKKWTNDVRTMFNGDKYTGDFIFSSSIKAEATVSALNEIVRELKEYAALGITDVELTYMKNAIAQRDAQRYELNLLKAGLMARMLDFDLPDDYVDQQNIILNSITKEEIDSLARKWINTDKMNIVLVGDKRSILPDLKKAGFEIVELNADGKPVN